MVRSSLSPIAYMVHSPFLSIFGNKYGGVLIYGAEYPLDSFDIIFTKMDLLIQVRDAEAPFLIELLTKFDFVEVVKPEDKTLLRGLETSLQQMKAMREGKLPRPAVEELFERGEDE